MSSRDQFHCNALYDQHLRTLQLKGLEPKTIEAYARAVRRLAEFLWRIAVRIPDSFELFSNGDSKSGSSNPEAGRAYARPIPIC